MGTNGLIDSHLAIIYHQDSGPNTHPSDPPQHCDAICQINSMNSIAEFSLKHLMETFDEHISKNINFQKNDTNLAKIFT